MSAEKVRYSGAWVDLSAGGGGGGGSAADQFPSKLTADGVDTATSSRGGAITATASATPHTAGSWVEVDSSLAANASALRFLVSAATSVTTVDSSTLLEIGTGASGSEVVWATIGVGYLNVIPAEFVVPGHLAAGTRVAVRARSAVASKAVSGWFSFFTEKTTAFGAPVTYQADTATSHGLILTAPGSLNTKSAWTQLVASTASDIAALLLCLQGASDTSLGSSGILVDIGVGGSGSETVIIGDVAYLSNAAENIRALSPITYGVDIPSGSRISARWARASASDTIDLLLVAATA